MATFLHNISGELITELLSENDNVSVKSISIANTGSYKTYVDLYIGTISKDSSAATTYYIYKNYLLHTGENLTINRSIPGKRGLYIKLTGVVTTSPTVDVIIN